MQANPWKSRCCFLVLLFTLSLLPRTTTPAPPDLVTDFEKSGGKQSPDYAQVMDYVKRLDKAAPWVRVESYGRSPEGRDMQVLIVDSHGRFTPAKAHSGENVVVLVQAGIHAGEIDGQEAGLMLIRAMAVDKTLAPLLDHVTLLFIPMFNIDGHEHRSAYNRPNQNGPEVQGFRANAINLNLNRDYLKADTPEMRAWLGLFNKWQPDFFFDCHVTDGADFQHVVTYTAEIWASTDSSVANWTKGYVKKLEPLMVKAGMPLAPYANFRRDNDPKSGLKAGPSTPRFSTGYLALRDRPAVLIETHMLKDYATRVKGTYEMLRTSLEVINEQHAALRDVISAADARAAALEKKTLPLSFDVVYTDSTMFDFLGFDYYSDKSDITGGKWVHFTDKPVTMRIPYFTTQQVTAQTVVPAAYIVPAAWTVVIDRLQAHGIRFARLDRAVTMDVATYRFSNAVWEAKPFEGHHSAKYDLTPVTEKMTFAPGSVVVDTAQPLARVAVNLLEPAAPDALVRWGYMDACFEQKEYFENYQLEKVIRKMLADSPKLTADFQAAKADTAFANHPDKIRRWFYERSPWYERTAGLYPVGRIEDRSVLSTLPLAQGRS
jgi:murein tripeptide amidase MpaA